MIDGDRLLCDKCGFEIEALSEEDALADIEIHGWTDWKTAQRTYCFECEERIWSPPCELCYSKKCERDEDCWAEPPSSIIPYETYFAEKVARQ